MTVWHWAAMGAGALVACGVLLLGVYFLIRRRADAMRTFQKGRLNAGEKMSRDVRSMLEELEQLADRIDARLNGKIQHLSDLLNQAQGKIDRLEELSSRSARDEEDPERPHDPAGREVLRLWGQGLDPVEIARRMEMDVGEVQLVLRLEKAQRANS